LPVKTAQRVIARTALQQIIAFGAIQGLVVGFVIMGRHRKADEKQRQENQQKQHVHGTLARLMRATKLQATVKSIGGVKNAADNAKIGNND